MESVVGSVFWAVILLLFPVAAQSKYSALCVMHKLDKSCDFVNAFSCYYTTNLQEISVTGWSLKLHDGQLQDKTYLALRNKCMLKTAETTSCDAFTSYFTRGVVETQPHCAVCGGLSRWRLHVLASPVSIVVERLIQEHDALVASWNVTTGQRIRLTCVSTCTSNSGFDRGHIWYKDGVRLREAGAGSSRVLLLDPVSSEHTGSYVCASLEYEFSPSSPVNLIVLAEIRPLYSDKDASPPQSVPEEESSRGWSLVSLFGIVVVVSVCFGLVVVTAVGIVARQKRRTKEGRQRQNQNPREAERLDDSVTSGSSCHIYTSLDVSSQSAAQYERLGNAQRCSDASNNYEN